MRCLPVFFLFLLVACDNPEPLAETTPAAVPPAEDLYALPSTDGEALNVVIEIPAGTNHKIEYHRGIGFTNDTLADGSDRIVNFLPYPGNYGFVPSTAVDERRGGDGDALDVLVIGESQPTGTRMRVLPIATLMLRDRGEIDTKIVAIPADTSLRTMGVENFLDFSLGNDAAKRIIETWFLNYKGPNVTELLRWEDESYAWREVRKWRTDPQ
ncbi:inorganic pyrophosphatase [Lewinella marina]|uniref:inorganic diphosphatase n=1 Tax=Neolewinella marina TaxID=438751 RepID=A0A2G0CJN9_9BACT|nr:inorganic diphosphatase [Neolewinella marina]NJB84639.1 inorganic pyrophosphatase [Neolewinella marina]PHL00187.1 inorganic pyrophosphatase [Neolewinella marina]